MIKELLREQGSFLVDIALVLFFFLSALFSYISAPSVLSVAFGQVEALGFGVLLVAFLEGALVLVGILDKKGLRTFAISMGSFAGVLLMTNVVLALFMHFLKGKPW